MSLDESLDKILNTPIDFGDSHQAAHNKLTKTR